MRLVKSTRHPRRSREGLRELLLQSALVEFSEKGFEGASTRSIAQRADAHQPQINYHFESKQALWEAAVEHLYGQLADALGEIPVLETAGNAQEVAAALAEILRRFVRFAAAHPELNRIVVHEATAGSERLEWMVDRHVRPIHNSTVMAWELLVAAGIAAPIHSAAIHHVIVGAASLVYVNAPEARLLTGADPVEPEFVEVHADGIVAMLLPGLTQPER